MDSTNTRYGARLFWSDRDQAYVAASTEFDGVSALGKSMEEAAAELKAALDLTLETYVEEGWSLPSPPAMPEYSGQFRLRLPRSLHQWLATTAEVEGVSLNTLAVQLLAAARGATVATEAAIERFRAAEHSLRAAVAHSEFALQEARQEASFSYQWVDVGDVSASYEDLFTVQIGTDTSPTRLELVS